MKPEIVNNFVQNSIIKPGTSLHVSYVNNDTFGLPAEADATFRVVRIIKADGKYYFTLSAIDKEKAVIAKAEQIEQIDGMTEERIISAFNLMDDGSKRPRKRRKRRTKQEMILAREQIGSNESVEPAA